MLKSNTSLLSPGDVALILRCSTRTVNRWGEQGLLGEITFTEGGQRRYQRDAIDAYQAAQEPEGDVA